MLIPRFWQSMWTKINLGWFVIARKVDAMSLDSHKLLDVDSEGYICCPVHVIISYTPPPQFVTWIASEITGGRGASMWTWWCQQGDWIV